MDTPLTEIDVQLHTGYRFPLGPVITEVNLLGGTILPQGFLYGDPGVVLRLPGRKSALTWSYGVITSRPDIRGLPDPQYRTKRMLTPYSSVSYENKCGTLIETSVTGFVKRTNHYPRISDNPLKLSWEPNSGAPLFSRGCSVYAGISPFDRLSLKVSGTLSKTERLSGDTRELFEWDIPWTIHPVLHVSGKEKDVHLYLTGMFSEGLPYRELEQTNEGVLRWSDDIKRVRWYRRFDLRFNFLQSVIDHPILTRFDAYVNIPNVFNILDGIVRGEWYWSNIREYYWDSELNKQPIELEEFRMNLV